MIDGRRVMMNLLQSSIKALKKYNMDFLLYWWPLRVASITLDISEVCNQVCVFCDRRIKFLESGRKPRFWDYSMFVQASGVFNYYSVVTFAGGCGEPLLNPYIRDILKYLRLKNPGVKVRILTNGVTLSPELFDEIKDYVDIIRFSINAFSENVYNELVIGSSFDRVMKNVSYVGNNKRKGLKVIVSYIGMRMNIEEFPLMVERADEMGIDEIHLQALSERGMDKVKGESLVRYPELLKSIWDKSREIVENRHLRVKLSVFDAYKAVIEGKKADVEEVGERGIARGNKVVIPGDGETRYCLAPFYSTIVDIEGNVVPCCSRTVPGDKKFGNILYDKVPPIKNRSFYNLRRALLTGELPDFCKYCNRAPVTKVESFKHEIFERFMASVRNIKF